MSKLNKYWFTSAQGVIVLVMLVVICILSPIVFPLFILGKLGQRILPPKHSAGENFQLLTSDFHRELYMSVEALLIDNQDFRRKDAQELLDRINNRLEAIENAK